MKGRGLKEAIFHPRFSILDLNFEESIARRRKEPQVKGSIT